MGRETILFKSEEKKSAADIASSLRQIADRIDTGTMTLKQGQTEVQLDFPGLMTLEIKVEEEQGRNRLKRSLEIELEWVPGEAETASGSTQIL